MPVIEYRYGSWKELTNRKKAKKEYWINKGCSIWKAEKLLFRYGY